MKVLVTGGTGLVGSHACRELIAHGHEVRLLVRSPEKAHKFYSSVGVSLPELVQGDVTDVASVAGALEGCEAVVHAAAGTPMQIESVKQLFDVNVGGVKNVIGAALEFGLQRIVYISSITAIFNTDGSKITSESPCTPSKMPYGQSKVEAEGYLRDLQAGGSPIAILYPGGIAGPDDPGFSDTCKAIKHRVENGFRIFGDGGMQYLDVRDLAAFVRSIVESGSSGRFVVPGVFSTWTRQADIVEDVTGCQLQRIHTSGWKLRLLGRAMDMARRLKKIDTPISAETMRYATLWPRIENTPELARHGITLRDPQQTFADTLAWMVQSGYLDAECCPKLG